MRPWVALTLTIAIWILSAVTTFTPFIEGSGAVFMYEGSHGTCTVVILELQFAIVSFVGSLLVVGIIIVTSVWTFCFARKFIHNQSEISGDNVYASKKKRLFGIFGAMLIVYGLCFTPGIINYAVVRAIFVADKIYLAVVISFIFVTVLSPIVQSYFRPEIKNKIVVICRKILQKPPQRDRVNYPVSSNDNSCGSKTETNRMRTSTQLTMSLDNALNTEHSSTTVV
uniref:G-protein coupled receptors family 1 profile domain-containing protein n=2 Tax=Amphimedon queenslandica TaxID=400682 RepID=A0A1X7T9V2_AMPQE